MLVVTETGFTTDVIYMNTVHGMCNIISSESRICGKGPEG